MLTMYDSVTVEAIPSDAEYCAGYVNGLYANIPRIEAHCPHVKHILTIDINGRANAECLDVEPGDASAAQVPGWVREQRLRGIAKPVVYTSASYVTTVLRALYGAGMSRGDIRLWSAHYIGPHICNPNCGYGNWTADGTQYTQTGYGRNLDISLLREDFFGPPPVVDPHHYHWFMNTTFDFAGEKVNERATVERYDKLRVHPHLHEKELHDLREDLSRLAGRVFTVAHEEPEQNGKPSWRQFHRGWRYQGLIKRAEGNRFV